MNLRTVFAFFMPSRLTTYRKRKPTGPRQNIDSGSPGNSRQARAVHGRVNPVHRIAFPFRAIEWLNPKPYGKCPCFAGASTSRPANARGDRGAVGVPSRLHLLFGGFRDSQATRRDRARTVNVRHDICSSIVFRREVAGQGNKRSSTTPPNSQRCTTKATDATD
jgi:hypothetical protein